jgi:predicted metal-dependent enzyme (double-stranded beta helix superfamily)
LSWPLDDMGPITDEPLTLLALERVVARVADRRELWGPRVDRSSPCRMYASLYRDAHVDVWAILWRPGSDTGWHDHDTSGGAVRVVEGALTERELSLGVADRQRVYRGGECFSFDPSRIHRLVCESACAISIHAYSAPLWRLGQYTVDQAGALHRVSVTYADELRPLDFATA